MAFGWYLFEGALRIRNGAEVDYVEDYERILRFRGYKADFSLNVEKI